MTKTDNIPKQSDLYWPVIRAFKALQSSCRQKQLVEKVCKDLKLTNKAKSELWADGPTTMIAYRISWVKDSLKRVGVLETPERGLWTLTKKGRGIASEKEAKKLYAEVQALIQRQKRSTSGAKKGVSRKSKAEDQGPEYLDEAWKGEILDAICAMKSRAFERLIKLLLSKLGFDDLVLTPHSGDGGIDVKGVVKEKNGIFSYPVLVQCKRREKGKRVDPTFVRDFKGALKEMNESSAIGIFITSGNYSDEVQKNAKKGVPVNLVNGDQLAEMLKDAGLGVKVETREIVTVMKDFFEKENDDD